MDSDFSEKLKKVLSDPEAMSKITAIASSLGASSPLSNVEEKVGVSEPEPQISPTEMPSSAPSDALPALMRGFSMSSDPRISLLSSIKPLLREEKREKIDALTRALALASMMKNLRK